jgi:hypothetical protein
MRNTEDEDQDEVRAPLVIQCGGCRTILGDSLSFVSASKELDAVILSGL